MLKLFTRMMLISVLTSLAIAGLALGQSPISTSTVTLSAEGLTAPENLPTGLNTLIFENASEAPFIGVLLRLNDGVMLDDFFASMAEDPLGMLPLVSLRGGPGVMPGHSTSVTYNLDAGEYVLINFAGETPQVATISVSGDENMVEEPVADVSVVMVDFGYGLPLTISTGEHLWRIENIGEQWHEIAITSVEADTTIADVQTLLAEDEMFATQQLPVMMPMDGGEVVWVTVDLQPGTYAIICNLPDIMNMEDMHLHYHLGMIQIVTVTDTVTYTDPNGLFMLDYPAALDAYSDLFEGLPFPNVAFSSSPEVNESSMVAERLPEGGWGVGLILLPKAMFTEMGMDEDTPITDIAQAFVMMQLAEGDENVSDEVIALMMAMMEIEAVELEGEIPAAQVNLPAPTEDNLVLFFEPAEGVIVLLSLLTAPDARSDEQIEQWLAMANSFVFTGTVEDIMIGMGAE